MTIRIDPDWGYRLPVMFRDRPETVTPIEGRLDAYQISQLVEDEEYDEVIGGTD